jgi:4-diphosphocytidyl-2-C-methyl-D-erythritol kinase
MSESLVLDAPAKLNLFLRVTGRRPDGYHTLQTVFQLLDWGDEVRLTRLNRETIRRDVDIEGVPASRDLAVRAARALQGLAREQGRPFAGAAIAVRKRIPQGSGLGGASTDAASVLLGLNELWQCGFSPRQLAALALELGADVPVFVGGHSAWAEGVGEMLTPLVLGPRWYVLVFPGLEASTASLFSDPGLERDSAPLTLQAGEYLCAYGNCFLPVLRAREPMLDKTVRRLSEFGVPRLTGTGSTLFLEAADEGEANRLTTALKKHYNVRPVQGVDRSPALMADGRVRSRQT